MPHQSRDDVDGVPDSSSSDRYAMSDAMNANMDIFLGWMPSFAIAPYVPYLTTLSEGNGRPSGFRKR
jgi:hypothetical protein